MYKKILIILLSVIMIVPISNSAFCATEEGLYLYINHSDLKTRIAFKFNNFSDMFIDFKKCGINSIMGIYQLSKADNNKIKVSPNVNRPSNLLEKSSTDWIGPYIVKSNTFGNSSLKESFTGGWHCEENNSKKPTAKTISVKIFADNVEAKTNKIISCSNVKITVINLITGYNTVSLDNSKKYIIKETVNYIITKGKIDVSNNIEALDNITLIKYYGLQTQNLAWKGKIYYLSGQNSKNGFSSLKYSTSGNKKYYPNVTSYAIYARDGKSKLTAWIDRSYGLGTMSFVAGNRPCAFTVGYGKSYFNLVNGINKVLKKGNKIFWRGRYTFN